MTEAHELLSLMPIVNFLQKRTYKMGENIQLQGTKMEGFTIICKGRCKVINILYHKRTNELTHKVRGLKGKLPNMCFGEKGKSLLT